jgi:hypothetical protein
MNRSTRPGRRWHGVLGGSLVAINVACFSGDQLGFVPCVETPDCDAPPRGESRRACLHAEADDAEPGYCALPCNYDQDCVVEAPAAWERAAVCSGPGGACILPCSTADDAPDELRCPTDQSCRSYRARDVPSPCDDDASCVCFPAE